MTIFKYDQSRNIIFEILKIPEARVDEILNLIVEANEATRDVGELMEIAMNRLQPADSTEAMYIGFAISRVAKCNSERK